MNSKNLFLIFFFLVGAFFALVIPSSVQAYELCPGLLPTCQGAAWTDCTQYNYNKCCNCCEFGGTPPCTTPAPICECRISWTHYFWCFPPDACKATNMSWTYCGLECTISSNADTCTYPTGSICSNGICGSCNYKTCNFCDLCPDNQYPVGAGCVSGTGCFGGTCQYVKGKCGAQCNQDGSGCPIGQTCNNGICSASGCTISGIPYANGTCNGKCQYCDISKSTTAWSNVPSGKICSGGTLYNVSTTRYCGKVGTCSTPSTCNGSMLYEGCYSGSCSSNSSYGYTDTSDDSECDDEICSSTNYCRNSCAWYTGKKCSDGSCTQGYGGGSCNPYSCSGGSCTGICSMSCGAQCESDADCPVGSPCQADCTCSGSPPFNFSILVSPVSGSVAQGSSVSPAPVATANLVSGATQSVTFGASLLSPAGALADYGISVSFSPSNCNPTCNSVMTINTQATTPADDYSINVCGTDGSLNRCFVYGLTVTLAGSSFSAPYVTTTAATAITSDSATLNGRLEDMGGAASCEVWFDWGATPSYGNTTPLQTITGVPPIDFSANLSGLSPGTYYFRARAKNGGSW